MILVVDVLNVFNKCRTSSTFLFVVACILLNKQVQAQAPTPPPYTVPNWDVNAPIGSIQGTYQMKHTSIDDHPPILATLWEIGTGDFDVVVWPPKYCAAVHVLFIPATFKGVGKFHVMQEIGTAPYIKFYPPIGRVDISVDGTTHLPPHFNQRSSVQFVHESSSNYVLEVAEEYVDKIKKFNAATTNKIKTVNFNLLNKVALVLTNSRYCFAHITRDGQNTEFYQLFDTEQHTNDPALPFVLTSYLEPRGIKSLFMPVVNPKDSIDKAKTVDLLPVLREPDLRDIKPKSKLSRCNGFSTSSANKLKKAIGSIAGESWLVRETNANAASGGRFEQVTIRIGSTCSWIRLWITEQSLTMKNYKQMNLSQTIDMFFEQQFFVGPDSDEARPLAGNSSHIDKITIRKHKNDGQYKDSEKQRHYAVQMSYGRDSGPSLPYIEYFQMPSFMEQNMRINLIKAPNCEANIISAPSHVLQTGNIGITNMFAFEQCERFILKNVNEDDVADE